MTQILKQATAVDVLIGPFCDRDDGYTAETGETPTVKLSKNGQALATKNDATDPVHDADGYYNCELDATDTDTVGTLILTVAASANALPVRHEFQVMEEAIYDALYGSGAGGFDANARVDVGKWLGTAVTTSSTSAKPEVDTYSVSDDATAANNLEAVLDGSGITSDVDITMRSLTITNDTGNAMTIGSTGADGTGLAVSGNGTGHGISAAGGSGMVSNGIYATSDATVGMGIRCGGTHGLSCVGDVHGIFASGASGSNGLGMRILGIGTGSGLLIESGDGATGNAMHCEAKSTNGSGMVAIGTGTGSDILADITGSIDLNADQSGVTVGTVTTLTGHTPQTGDTYAALPSNFSVMGIEADGDLTKVNTLDGHTAQTGDTYAELPTNFSDLAITATDGYVTAGTVDDKTGYSISGSITTLDGLNDVSAADVNAEVDTAIEDYHLDHLLAVDYDPASPPGVATALLNELVENDSGESRFTVNALENAPSGSGASAETIADAVWDEARADHTGVGSFGETVGTVESNIDYLDASIAGLNDVSAAEVNAEVDTALADYDGPTKTEMDTAFTEIKGATWDTTDTLEAIRDRGDSAWVTATDVDLNTDQSGVTIGTVNALATDAIADVWETDTLTESYAADGAAPTPAQALFLIQQALTEFAITSTTISVKKLDGTTEAATFTLDDDTSPTSRTRAT